MKWLPRTAWSFVLLGLVAGCTGDETQTPAGGSPATKPGAAPDSGTRGVPPVTQPAPIKDTGPKDMAKPAGDGKGHDTPALEPPKTEPAKDKTEPAKEKTADVKLSDEELASIKKLPPADQELAIKQAVCPVSGDHLGGEMGMPIKVTAEGRSFFLCCDGCKDEVKKDPKGVIAKLDARLKK